MRCGFCRASCPVFEEGRAEYGSARGKLSIIYALERGELEPGEGVYQRIFECLVCGRCGSACPAGVNTIDVFVEARERLIRHRLPWRKRLAFRIVESERALSLAGKIASLPLPTSSSYAERAVRAAQRKGEVALFAGCLARHVQSSLLDSSVHVLQRLGYDVRVVDDAGCCGAPLYFSGARDRAKTLVERNLRALSELEDTLIVTPCPTCKLTLTLYHRIAGETQGKEASRIAGRALEICEFLGARGFGESSLRLERKVTYHDSCHMSHALNLSHTARALVTAIPGVELVEMDEPSACCGFGGLFAIDNPQLSRSITERKVEDILRTGADVVVTPCPGCKLHLGRSMRARGIEVWHPVELLGEALKKR